MGLKDKFISFIAPEDEVYEEGVEFEKDEYQKISSYEKPNRSARPRVKTDATMVLFEPRTFEESEEVAVHLKEKRAAVVNLKRLPANFAQRTIDFLTGVIFALDGSIQKLDANVILCAPPTMGVEGEIDADGTGDGYQE